MFIIKDCFSFHLMNKIPFFEYPLCRNNFIYYFSYFFFISFNILGFIYLYNYKEIQDYPILLLILGSSVIFFTSIISRCICLYPRDQDNNYLEF